MTKADLVAQVAKKAGLTAKAAKDAVSAVFGTVSDALKRGEKVVVTGFGTFVVRKRAARKGRNPQTGEEIKIKACNVVKFRPGKKLKEAI